MFYQKTQKLLELGLWMQNAENGVSIADIMQKFKVSKRTAIRMKDMVKEQFPQIKEINGAHNTKRWYIPPCSLGQYVGFSLTEINALQNAIKLMKTKMPEDVAAIETVMHKIKASMSSEALNRIEPDAEALLEAEGYALRPGPKIKIDDKFMQKLRNAVIACKVIKIKYQSKTKNEWRTVYPYGFLYGNKHYLIAWHTKKKAMCHFDLNNIQDIQVTDEYFTRNPEFSLEEFSRQSFGVYQEEPFDVEWKFDKEVAPEAAKYIFHPTQEMISNPDGTLTVKFHAGGAREMDWHLYTWGKHVKVIKPKDFNKRKVWKA
ncbi:MAG: WYL domain-containing protein [Alphaproteobacteria bacterium]|nr:WYL domain-containing protein [Alphaproteobacteria bacterium]